MNAQVSHWLGPGLLKRLHLRSFFAYGGFLSNQVSFAMYSVSNTTTEGKKNRLNVTLTLDTLRCGTIRDEVLETHHLAQVVRPSRFYFRERPVAP